MKPIHVIATVLALFLTGQLFAQDYAGRSVVLNLNDYQNKAFLVGSLPKSNDGVYQKLKISIFGGNWHNNNTAENDYYISTRDGIVINQEVHGGSYSKYDLKVLDNGVSYDFVIIPTDHFTSFNLKAWLHDNSGLKSVTITDYSLDGKTDITSSVSVNKIFVTSHGGAIGIGKSPEAGHKLDVAGTIRATEIIVEAQTADFVFADDYSLRNLGEVESFIKTHKHLPDVPSAAQMEANGVNLAEMNKLLLQKVEELVLYAIDKEKEVQSLKSKVETQEERLARIEEMMQKE